MGGKLRAHWEEVAGTDLLGLGLWCEAAALRAERGAQVGSFVGGFIDGVVHVGWTPASEDEREPFAQTPVHPTYRMGHPPGGQSGGAADVVEHPNCKLGVGLDVDGCGCRHTGETLQDVFGRNSKSVELAFVVGTFAQALMDCRRGQEGPSGVYLWITVPAPAGPGFVGRALPSVPTARNSAPLWSRRSKMAMLVRCSVALRSADVAPLRRRREGIRSRRPRPGAGWRSAHLPFFAHCRIW